jgi:FdhE protein
MRIDYRENCGGHLKTCNGEDNEALLFADWTSLHLDIVASDRGLKRLDASFYHLGGGVLNSTVNSSGSSHG